MTIGWAAGEARPLIVSVSNAAVVVAVSRRWPHVMVATQRRRVVLRRYTQIFPFGRGALSTSLNLKGQPLVNTLEEANALGFLTA